MVPFPAYLASTSMSGARRPDRTHSPHRDELWSIGLHPGEVAIEGHGYLQANSSPIRCHHPVRADERTGAKISPDGTGMTRARDRYRVDLQPFSEKAHRRSCRVLEESAPPIRGSKRRPKSNPMSCSCSERRSFVPRARPKPSLEPTRTGLAIGAQGAGSIIRLAGHARHRCSRLSSDVRVLADPAAAKAQRRTLHCGHACLRR